MSKNVVGILNRLLTASMLVVSLIACQQMPDDNTNTFNFQEDLSFNLER